VFAELSGDRFIHEGVVAFVKFIGPAAVPPTFTVAVDPAPVLAVIFAVVGLRVRIATVAGNSNVNVTEFPFVPGDVFDTIALLVLIDPVKPVGNVNPGAAVSVMLAVYCVPPVNGLLPGDHVTVPLVKLPGPVDAPLGAAPVVGAVTFTAALVI